MSAVKFMTSLRKKEWRKLRKFRQSCTIRPCGQHPAPEVPVSSQDRARRYRLAQGQDRARRYRPAQVQDRARQCRPVLEVPALVRIRRLRVRRYRRLRRIHG